MTHLGVTFRQKMKSFFLVDFDVFKPFWTRFSYLRGLKTTRTSKKKILKILSKNFFFPIFSPNHTYTKNLTQKQHNKIKTLLHVTKNHKPQDNAKEKGRVCVHLIFIVKYRDRVSTIKVFHEHRILERLVHRIFFKFYFSFGASWNRSQCTSWGNPIASLVDFRLGYSDGVSHPEWRLTVLTPSVLQRGKVWFLK